MVYFLRPFPQKLQARHGAIQLFRGIRGHGDRMGGWWRYRRDRGGNGGRWNAVLEELAGSSKYAPYLFFQRPILYDML